MVRRFAALATLLALAATPQVGRAQDPLAAPDMRFNGTWKLDVAGSDTLPTLLKVGAASGRGTVRGTPPSAADAGAAAGGAAGGGRGGGRGGGGGGGGGRGGGGRGGGAPGDPTALAEIMAEVAPETLTFEVTGSSTKITAGVADPVEWLTDKKKRLVALPKGGTFEMESSWWTKALQTIRTVDKDTELKRDIKLIENGAAMEVKLAAKISGKKAEAKLRYVKAQ